MGDDVCGIGRVHINKGHFALLQWSETWDHPHNFFPFCMIHSGTVSISYIHHKTLHKEAV